MGGIAVCLKSIFDYGKHSGQELRQWLGGASADPAIYLSLYGHLCNLGVQYKEVKPT